LGKATNCGFFTTDGFSRLGGNLFIRKDIRRSPF
jgi:hypothetical protein